MGYKIRRIMIVGLLLLMVIGLAGCGNQTHVVQAVDSVVYISGNCNGGNGFIVCNSDGQTYVLTTASALGEKYGDIEVNTSRGSQTATVIDISNDYDLALLKLNEGLDSVLYPAVPLSKSFAITLGNLYSIYYSSGKPESRTLTIVQIEGRYTSTMKDAGTSADIYTLADDHSNNINGAPILAAGGEVIGIASFSDSYQFGVHNAVISTKIIHTFLRDNGFRIKNTISGADVLVVFGLLLVLAGSVYLILLTTGVIKKKTAGISPELADELQAMIDNARAERLKRAELEKSEEPEIPVVKAEPVNIPKTGKVCPSCHREVVDDGAFCTFCGSPISDNTCPKCKSELPPDARFCPVCGTEVVSAE